MITDLRIELTLISFDKLCSLNCSINRINPQLDAQSESFSVDEWTRFPGVPNKSEAENIFFGWCHIRNKITKRYQFVKRRRWSGFFLVSLRRFEHRANSKLKTVKIVRVEFIIIWCYIFLSQYPLNSLISRWQYFKLFSSRIAFC